MKDRHRAAKLAGPPSTESILSLVVQEASDETLGLRRVTWEGGTLMKGCSRAKVFFPLSPDTFDALFNGRSGYRAQYYLSIQEGVRFNRILIDALRDAVRSAYCLHPLEQSESLILHSFDGPWSKAWIYEDRDAFQNAPQGELLPRRWVESNPDCIGLCAPLPLVTAVELKGTWVSDIDHGYKQDCEYKGDRDQRLHETGHV
jgi:hypothetical protein